MKFNLLNKPKEKGYYAFSGKALVTSDCNLCLSKKEITDIKKQVFDYTQKQARDYLLIFENSFGERVYAIDNMSIYEIEERKKQGESDKDIEAMNYYTLIYRR